ncbi:MFS transporter [Antarcticibacterium flavum]|uniref:MFS transporter n=1 Tax=Antarcticibacterium flavum TaxID=2058175 RepID=A0A5B7X0C9_9FLAO|nr:MULTISPECIES: MFS transporter [Antarcticibacterium]MCM4160736.1 MFS transporter [Antarcticibacterium sp. W02-3]QCY68787.1 MFS transporter [Antarcticibacterium flavum]
MLKHIYRSYIGSFSGLRREVWLLALITFINRAGTMVIPFLSLYLTKSRNFTLEEVGWILTFFGLGSVAGSWLGGRLTDAIGHYKTMAGSLLISSVLFVLLQFPTTFWGICIGIFLVMLAADAFRPAVFVAINAYSKPENRTRSITLIRLAINLGFSAGPAVGGLIIAGAGYSGLFWVDGITCFLAGILLLKLLHPKRALQNAAEIFLKPKAVLSDRPYLIFILAMILFGFIFIQYFSTMPLYYAERYFLSEFQIGLLLGFNGFMIFLLEMPLIKYLEGKLKSHLFHVITGCFLVGLSYLLINITGWAGILIVAMFFLTLGEMIAFPFSNSFALKRAEGGKQGSYMALYSIAFSISHIFGHNTGMQLISKFGYEFTWYVMLIMGLGACTLLFFAGSLTRKELRQVKGQIL